MIAVKWHPRGFILTILMLAIDSPNSLVTMFNPWAKKRSQGLERIGMGLDKLFDTNAKQRGRLYTKHQ